MTASDAGGSIRGAGSSTSSIRAGASGSTGSKPRCWRAAVPTSGGGWRSAGPHPHHLSLGGVIQGIFYYGGGLQYSGDPMEAGTTVQIRMPEMGESVTEGTILDWLVQVGDEGEAEQGLVEVSTDKVDTEGPSPASGVLTKILVEPDETVPVGTVLGEISPSASNGSAPDELQTDLDKNDSEWASDESAVEEAEHGAAAEEENEAAK